MQSSPAQQRTKLGCDEQVKGIAGGGVSKVAGHASCMAGLDLLRPLALTMKAMWSCWSPSRAGSLHLARVSPGVRDVQLGDENRCQHRA